MLLYYSALHVIVASNKAGCSRCTFGLILLKLHNFQTLRYWNKTNIENSLKTSTYYTTSYPPCHCCQVHHAFQQTGFHRVKRGFRDVPAAAAGDSWSQLRASLDAVNPAVVHPEQHYSQLQAGAQDTKEKRGYNPLKVSGGGVMFV